MTAKLSVEEVLATLEARSVFHREQEALHAEREVHHREQRTLHAAELARVQEAKEIPTVKVIDTPMIPERKSFPPRLVIVILGAILSLAVTLAWLFFLEAWRHIDPADPRRILGEQIARSVRETVSRIRFSARKRRILAGT